MSSSLNTMLAWVWFHTPWKEKTSSVIQAGLTWGITMLHRVRICPAPSMVADSISGVGTCSMNCFIKNSPSGVASCGRIYTR